MPDPPRTDTVAETLREAIEALIEGDDQGARNVLTPLAAPKIIRAVRSSLPLVTQIAIYRRDSFTCRYCGRRTVLLPVLRLISELFRDLFPYHASWRYGEIHPAYLTHSTSCDHVLPVTRGGTNDESNLVTTCALCNYMKSAWTLEELSWELREPAGDDWDGLARLYTALAPRSAERYHRTWLRALGTDPANP